MRNPPVVPSDETSSAQSWLRFKSGDPIAFGNIAKEHYSSLYNYASKFSKDKEFIRDCIQDLFFDLWKRRESLSETMFVRAYLLKAVRNKVLKAIQKKDPAETFEEWSFEPIEHQLSHENFIIGEEEQRYQLLQLQTQIRNLSKRQQEIIYLHYYQQVDFKEIARIMNLSRPSVANLLSRTLKDLKERWPSALVILVISLISYADSMIVTKN